MEYIVDLNGTKAAERAGYSSKSAPVQAHRLLRNDKVQAEIQNLMDERGTRLEITADIVLQELAKLALYDPRKLFNSDGSPKHITELDKNTAVAISGFDVHELFDGDGEQKHAYGLMKKIRLADKIRALEQIGKHLQLFTEKPQDEGRDRMHDLLFAIRGGPTPKWALDRRDEEDRANPKQKEERERMERIIADGPRPEKGHNEKANQRSE
jgi:phage terminase small subunit